MDSSPEKASQLVKDEIAKWAPIVMATEQTINPQQWEYTH